MHTATTTSADTKGIRRRGVLPVLLTLALLVLAACSGAEPSGSASEGAGEGQAGDEQSTSLRLWHYEAPNSAMGIAWEEAIRQFD